MKQNLVRKIYAIFSTMVQSYYYDIVIYCKITVTSIRIFPFPFVCNLKYKRNSGSMRLVDIYTKLI